MIGGNKRNMKRYIRSAQDFAPRNWNFNRGIDVDESSVFSWNGYFFGKKNFRGKPYYFKSKNVRFDDTCGGTAEISSNEYQQFAEKYANVFRDSRW